MQTLDLRRIMGTANLKASQVGELLFPDNRKPSAAVQRVCRGEALLNSDQVAKLAEFIGVPVGLLFDKASWRMSVPKGGEKIIEFRTYNYFAELNLSTMETIISYNGLSFFERMSHPAGVGISEYLADLTDLIIKYKLK